MLLLWFEFVTNESLISFFCIATLQLASVSKVIILLARFPTRCVHWSITNALKCGPTAVMVMSNAHVAVPVASEGNAANCDSRICISTISKVRDYILFVIEKFY